jgi:diketogulonate reductase-like aldo/keto reductase
MAATPAVPDISAPLPGGEAMPLLGFGTWQITGRQARLATGWALEAGYRHLDTATVYGNETDVGAGLAGSGVARGDVFITTKCPPRNAGRELATLERSLEALGTDHVDLWLIHWPPDKGVGVDLWEALIGARSAGLARAIGVSNYSLAEIDELVSATGVTPAVNQVEWSPLLFDRVQLEGHREQGIVLEGYSALRGGTLDHPVITEIAGRLGRTPAQVIIRWHLEHGVVVIPKSVVRERIFANADVGGFELTAEDTARLDALGLDALE